MSTKKSFNPEKEKEELRRKTILEKYNAVITERWKPYHDELAEAMYIRAGSSKDTINKVHNAGLEAARAFFIHLIITKYGLSEMSDILLMDMGLLDGYQSESGVMERRKKYFIESDYRASENPDEKSNKDTTADVLDKRASDMNKIDVPLFQKMMVYFDSIEDKDAFFETACMRFLEVPKNSNGVAKVRYPIPHYKIRFENPIKHLPMVENKNFCGRKDIINKLESGFFSRYERSIQMLYGAGGVGKTEIALKYAYDHFDEYSTIVWLNAASISSLEKDVLRFLAAYSNKGTDGLSDTESIAIAFCRFINQRVNSLIILDDADYIDRDSESGERELTRLNWFIPKKHAHTLITTRCNVNVRGINRIAVDVFEEDEALDFLEKRTGINANNYAEELATKLGFLPLALEYAGAYIEIQNISYKEYIEKWERVGMKLFDGDYAITTIRKAFHVTLEKITTPFTLVFLQCVSEYGNGMFHVQDFLDRKKQRNVQIRKQLSEKTGEMSLLQCDENNERIIYQISDFFEDGSAEVIDPKDPQHHIIIPQNPFIVALEDEMILDEIIRELKEYSLIHWNNDFVFMHPLLQSIVMDDLHKSGAFPLVGRLPNEMLVI